MENFIWRHSRQLNQSTECSSSIRVRAVCSSIRVVCSSIRVVCSSIRVVCSSRRVVWSSTRVVWSSIGVFSFSVSVFTHLLHFTRQSSFLLYQSTVSPHQLEYFPSVLENSMSSSVIVFSFCIRVQYVLLSQSIFLLFKSNFILHLEQFASLSHNCIWLLCQSSFLLYWSILLPYLQSTVLFSSIS